MAVVALGLVLTLGLLWSLRWLIGSQAIRITDPAVRGWLAGEVRRLSDSVYRVTLSPLQVDAAAERITIDTITLRTDSVRNAARRSPLPALALRLHGCMVSRIDLARLAAGNGFRAGVIGCDSVRVAASVPRQPDSSDSGTDASLLTLRDSLDLPSSVPSFLIDSVRFPSVHLDLHIADAARPTDIALEHLEVMLDSVGYDPADSAARTRPLLARRLAFRLEDFEGSRTGEQLTFALLSGDLTAGVVRLRELAWSPTSGPRADSLGLSRLAVDSLDVTGIDWRAFVTRGDVRVRSIRTTGLAITTTPGDAASREDHRSTWTVAGALASLDRAVAIDTVEASDSRIRHRARDGGTATTTARLVRLTGVRSAGRGVGPLRFVAAGIAHQWREYHATLDSLLLDLPAGRAEATGLRYAPEGSDGDFARRRQYRADRIEASLSRLALTGLDGTALVERGEWRLHALRLDRLRLDVLSDKRLPPRPTPSIHRTPQVWLATVPLTIRIDTIATTGEVTYRERNAETGMIGVLRFADVTGSLADFATQPSRRAPPIRFLATTKLMGMAPLQVQVSLPPAAGTFAMHWQGNLAGMPAAGLNRLLIAVGDATFEEGQIDHIAFEATTSAGHSVGTARPRYHDLSVSLPGVGRNGPLGGLRRAIAGAVANTFVLREDNVAGGDTPPVDGTIDHAWNPSETLIQHLWIALRGALVEVLKP